MKPIVKQKQPVVQYAINKALTGGGGGGGTAADTTYDNTTSGLTATDVQDAIDEVVSDLSGYVPMETNYFTVNGIRVYVASTAPTGTIPDGSIGLGF